MRRESVVAGGRSDIPTTYLSHSMGLRSQPDRSTSEAVRAAGPFNSTERSVQSPKSVLAHPQSTKVEKIA